MNNIYCTEIIEEGILEIMKMKAGVLRGGPSGEYDVSLKTGAAVLKNLPERYEALDILIDKTGRWYTGGREQRPANVLAQCDVIFNALHGEFGEDGTVQRTLDAFGVPYTGTGAFGSALAMNKHTAKQAFRAYNLPTPRYTVVYRNEVGDMADIRELFRTFPQPCVIKPSCGGSSLGTTRAYSFSDFKEGLRSAFLYSDTVLVEMCIEGREATCGLVEAFRGEELYALPPVEIIPPEKRFFDYETKYNGSTREICPTPNIEPSLKQEIMEAAKTAHRALHLRHYSRADFIISRDGVYVLEINTLPGLTEQSLFPKACGAVGCGFSAFLEHLLTLAMRRAV